MLANFSYLIMAAIFLLCGIYAYDSRSFFVAVILIWFFLVFFLFWFLHFSKINYDRDYGLFLVKDSLVKEFLLSGILFPFYMVTFLSSVIQTISKEESISKVTQQIFMGQQLLWFHQKIFRSRKIAAVLDITIEHCEPYFIRADASVQYLKIPVLDKTSPSIKQLEEGVQWGMDQMAQGKNLYVHCGAGHERSATFVAALLLRLGKAKEVDEAMKLIQRYRPKARFVGNQQKILEKWYFSC